MIQPLGDLVQVQLLEQETKTGSGIVLANHSEMSYLVREVHSNTGIVLSIGKDIKAVGIGDLVYFGRWGLKKEGDMYFIREDNILLKNG